MIRTGSELGRGYLLEQFKEAFERHLPPFSPETPSATVTPLQDNDSNGLEQKQTVTEGLLVTAQNGDNILKNNDCYGVTVQSPLSGEREVCAQCGAASPGPLLHALVAEGEVRLHRECLRFWLKSHPQPTGRPIPLIQITEVPRTDIANGQARR